MFWERKGNIYFVKVNSFVSSGLVVLAVTGLIRVDCVDATAALSSGNN